ncbi:hypothetical protein HYG86_03220 [Alkalicella caledoniensis]|uniref:Lipoprotein n=1 Tax=Alkalicella caledoniensis TaxID=2731377 RepID=A0A7G9W582_ALKCA|nr:hypothetical protein [Alkalicella caledoniensis]QNO13844.1 hypothetical protein HYG86_03220 [Alkalicella caledoniensis]
MRKIFTVLLVTILMLSLVGCSRKGKTTNVISQAELNAKEELFLSVGTTSYFVFDFKLDDEFKWIDIWVERYEFGEKIDTFIGMGSTLGNEGVFIFAIDESEGINNWTIVLQDEGGKSTTKASDKLVIDETKGFSKMWGVNNNIKIADNDITLASISYKNDGREMFSFTGDFYENPEANKQQMVNYDIVYLLRIKLSK